VTERAAVYLAALLMVALALAVMGGLHQQHYKNRKLQLLEGRISSLERIMLGEHE
jgi:hypothetical protein